MTFKYDDEFSLIQIPINYSDLKLSACDTTQEKVITLVTASYYEKKKI